ncbi:hypothetical protein EDI_192870 [Entamoeba dispar SAW760]|uniref:Uncharacterized protein n=1 Tax=Entamoeba dispar (strain ATCC PRA-260 / SAW760) TaxID=370354 RepID=B0EH27_ENTDS|nr:uncharacterized protein EDI_192870 [Entamoeba dispar SAW760]EDR26176.1 hypothetical protein EDI_192870 [Entamoeba dispar SAW760]|eukprot:EDR26176.1 hypothetical protein EDI_192870 [Entamoeba dispar SAW760]
MEEIYNVTALAQEIKDAGQTYFDIISEKTTYRLENFPEDQSENLFIPFNQVSANPNYVQDSTTTKITFAEMIPHLYSSTTDMDSDATDAQTIKTNSNNYYTLIKNTDTSEHDYGIPTNALQGGFFAILFNVVEGTTTREEVTISMKTPSTSSTPFTLYPNGVGIFISISAPGNLLLSNSPTSTTQQSHKEMKIRIPFVASHSVSLSPDMFDTSILNL